MPKGGKIKALSLWIIFQIIMTFSQSGADGFLNLLNNVPPENKSSVTNIIEYYENTCAEYQSRKNNPSLIIKSENFISTKLIQGNTNLTVVIADFECPGYGHPWTGSTWSPTYLIIGNRIFRGPNSRPTFHNLANHTLLVLWHHGSYCKTVDNDDYPGASPSFSAIYWNEYYETFVTYDGNLNVKEIN